MADRSTMGTNGPRRLGIPRPVVIERRLVRRLVALTLAKRLKAMGSRSTKMTEARGHRGPAPWFKHHLHPELAHDPSWMVVASDRVRQLNERSLSR